jgi:protein-disulfide isomerase
VKSSNFEGHAYAERVRTDFESGVKSGVSGTPTLFINDTKHEGSWHESDLRAVLKTAVEDRAEDDISE